MKTLLSESKKIKMTSEDGVCINVCSLIVPFMVSAKTLTESLGSVHAE